MRRAPVHGWENIWYRRHPLALAMLPLAGLYCLLVWMRRLGYRLGLLRRHRLAVPVIVVGNITVGGTGKTPLVLWLCELLQAHGQHPGIVSRGYRGKARNWPQQVRPDSDPRMVGDEPVLLARRSGCPVAVGPDRVAAGRALLQYSDCDIIVADDGLQHLALERDVEIAVVDGIRRFGNGHCLPAGPLREPRRRLTTVDFVVVNGLAGRGEYGMRLEGGRVVPLQPEQASRPLSDYRGQRVHAVAGIGNPQRFFTALEQAGLEVIPHPFPDHHAFTADDLRFGDDLPVLMTEKDAVKCQTIADERMAYVPVEAEVDPRLGDALLRRLASFIEPDS